MWKSEDAIKWLRKIVSKFTASIQLYIVYTPPAWVYTDIHFSDDLVKAYCLK